jgi:hypothetical protein
MSNIDLSSDDAISRAPTNDQGVAHEWHSLELAGTWTLMEQWQRAGEPMPVRCTTIFSDDGTVTSKWEYASDG